MIIFLIQRGKLYVSFFNFYYHFDLKKTTKYTIFRILYHKQGSKICKTIVYLGGCTNYRKGLLAFEANSALFHQFAFFMQLFFSVKSDFTNFWHIFLQILELCVYYLLIFLLYIIVNATEIWILVAQAGYLDF